MITFEKKLSFLDPVHDLFRDDPHPHEDLIAKALELARPAESVWRRFAQLSPNPHDNNYARHVLFNSDDYQIVLIGWHPGQGTAIHDHGGSRGADIVLSAQGFLRENVYERANSSTDPLLEGLLHFVGVQSLVPGVAASISESDIHQVENPSHNIGPVHSLHVYAKPIATSRRYASGQVVSKPTLTGRMSHDSLLGRFARRP